MKKTPNASVANTFWKKGILGLIAFATCNNISVLVDHQTTITYTASAPHLGLWGFLKDSVIFVNLIP